MGFKVKLTLYGSLHSSIVRTEGVTWKIGGIKAFCSIRVYHGCQKFTWFLIIGTKPRQQGARHQEKRPPSILVFWERTFWTKVIRVKLKRNIYILKVLIIHSPFCEPSFVKGNIYSLKVLMLVPSHLYSPFCEPSFVKGGAFHSGKLAFNTYVCIQFKYKNWWNERCFLYKFFASTNFLRIQITYLPFNFDSPHSIY